MSPTRSLLLRSARCNFLLKYRACSAMIGTKRKTISVSATLTLSRMMKAPVTVRTGDDDIFGAVVVELGHREGVVGHPRHQLSCRLLVVEAERQLLIVLEQFMAHVPFHLRAHEVALIVDEHHAERMDDDQRHHQRARQHDLVEPIRRRRSQDVLGDVARAERQRQRNRRDDQRAGHVGEKQASCMACSTTGTSCRAKIWARLHSVVGWLLPKEGHSGLREPTALPSSHHSSRHWKPKGAPHGRCPGGHRPHVARTSHPRIEKLTSGVRGEDARYTGSQHEGRNRTQCYLAEIRLMESEEEKISDD